MTSTSPVSRLRRLVAPDRADLLVILVYAIGAGVLGLATPVGVQAMVNTVGFGQTLDPVIVLSVLVVIGVGFAAALKALQIFAIEILQRRLFARVALSLGDRLGRVRTEAASDERLSGIVNRFFEVLTLQKSAATMLLDGINLVLATTVGLVVLAVYHPLFLVFGAILALCLFAIWFGAGKIGVATAIEESAAKYRLVAWLEEIARRRATFRAAPRLASRVTDLATKSWVEARRRHFRIVFGQTVATLVLQVVVTGALLAIGGALVLGHQLALGQLVAAELIVTAVTSQVARSGKYLESLYDLLAAVDKIGVLEDLPLVDKAEAETTTPVDAPATLVLDGTTLVVEEREVLSSATAVIRAGELVVVEGDTASGKSRIAELLGQLREPSVGRLDLDGIDVRDWDAGSLRASVLLIRPGELFAGSVRENVSLGRAVGVEQIRNALEATLAWPEIARLEDGLMTQIGGGESALSDGTATRVLLARAACCKPRLLVVDGLDALDEATRIAAERALAGLTVVWFTRDARLAPRGRTLHLDQGLLHERAKEVRS